MRQTTRIGLSTAAALALLGAVESLLCLAVLAQWQVVRSPGPASLDEALTLVVVTAAAVLGGWLALGTVAALLAHLPGRLGVAVEPWARAWAPALSRRVAAVLVGAAVGGALAPGTALGDGSATPSGTAGITSRVSTSGPGFTTTASSTSGPGFTTTASSTSGPGFTTTAPPTPTAAPTPAPNPVPTPDPATRADSPLTPGWTPVRPVQRPQPASGLVTGGGGTDSRPASEVVVHRGDTLWDIARRHLGPDASDAEVANAWPAWHEANRSVIGADPDLILPGQVLRAPGRAGSSVASPSRAAR